MRDIDVKEVTRAVAECCIDSCNNLPEGVLKKLEAARKEEISPLGCQVLDTIIENAKLANKKQVPLCQDTGLTVVKGYTEGYLRKSSVDDPVFLRKNTQDNTPAIIHCRIVPGDKVHLVILPKGCGSENMSQLRMLKPADGLEGIINFVLEAVRTAGPNPCPPVTVGVGVGGNAEKATRVCETGRRPAGAGEQDRRRPCRLGRQDYGAGCECGIRSHSHRRHALRSYF